MAHVLVVDDEPDLRLLLRINLEVQGHRVSQAGDGAVALTAVAAEAPDVVVLDVMMPVLDGWGVLERLRAGGADLPVIVVSAKDDPASVRRAFELGADDHLAKPFDLDELVGAVEVHLGRTPAERAAARAERLAGLAS